MEIYNIAKTAIINTNGEVLLLRRSKSDPRRPGDWDLPGGHIEAGEDPISAGAREALEEAGIRLDLADVCILFARTTPYKVENRSITQLLLYSILLKDQAVALSFEHDDYKWVSPETAAADLAHLFYGEGLRYALDCGLLKQS